MLEHSKQFSSDEAALKQAVRHPKRLEILQSADLVAHVKDSQPSAAERYVVTA